MPKRDWRLDLVRSVAIFFVVSAHFLVRNGFYSHAVVGPRMCIMVLMRAIFIICVPLFMLLTGYLVRGSITKKYFLKIWRVLLIYLIASIACIAYSIAFLNVEYDAISVITGILGFSADPYSWYVEMYLGLFLLTPFLSMLWDSLDKQQRKVLILVMVIVAFLPSVSNVYVLDDSSWWLNPSSNTEYNQLVPAWWARIYPIGYYFMGRWLAEYGLPLNRRTTAIALVASIAILALFDCWRCYGTLFIKGSWNGYGSLFAATTALLVFWLCITLPEKAPRGANVLAFVSKLSFSVYLISWIWDQVFYSILRNAVPSVPGRLDWYFVIVPAVFICSLATAWVMQLPEKLIVLYKARRTKR